MTLESSDYGESGPKYKGETSAVQSWFDGSDGQPHDLVNARQW